MTVIVFIIGILWVLATQSWPALQKFGIVDFVTSLSWDPVKENFGAATSIFGTVVTTVLSLTLAIPLAIGIAIFITEIAPNCLKGPVGMAIELLAAIRASSTECGGSLPLRRS